MPKGKMWIDPDPEEPRKVVIPSRPNRFSRVISYLTPLAAILLLLWVGSATALGVAYWQARGELVKKTVENENLKKEVTGLKQMLAPAEKPTKISWFETAEKLPSVFFKTDKSSLDRQAKKELGEAVKFMKDNPKTLVSVTGLCDPRGSTQYNLTLGKKRAQVVKDYFVAEGIDPSRIIIASAGEELSIPIKTLFSKQRRADILVVAQTPV